MHKRPPTQLSWAEALPIVRRELQIAARRKITFRLRFAAALAGAVVFIAITLIVPEFSTVHGEAVFWLGSTVAALVCALSGLSLTIDSLIKEKREGTLGLLFLTRLSGLDIILGKLAAAALSAGAIAFSFLPFLAISVCLGGVTAAQFWKMSGALLLLLGYSLTLGIFLSALLRREALAGLIFLAAIFMPIILHSIILVRPAAISALWQISNPFLLILSIIDLGKVTAANSFAPKDLAAASGFLQALAIPLLIFFSAIILPRTVKATSLSPIRNLKQRAKLPWSARLRRAALQQTPTLWLHARKNHPLALLWMCLVGWLIVRSAGFLPPQAESIYAFLLAILPKFFVAWHASGIMADERRAGGLEILLTTPIATRELLAGKMRAIQRQFLPALVFALVVQWLSGTHSWAMNKSITAEATLLFAMMITLLIDVYAIAWIGLWQGLHARDRASALFRTSLLGLFAPWIPPVLFGAIFHALFEPLWMRQVEFVFIPLYIGATVLTVAIACWAMGRLHDGLRGAGAERWTRRLAALA